LLSVAVTGGTAQDDRTVAIQSMDVRENLYVISGGGGHTAALVTENDGVVLVDTKLGGWGQSILETMRLITDQPISTIINTHTHGDHVGGNVDFPATVQIVAHENAATRMRDMEIFAGAGAVGLPDRTVGDTMTLFEGRDQIDLYHFGAGHTDGDIVVVFPALGTAHLGDLFAFMGTPYIDVNNGGSGIAYPETLDRIVASIDGVRRVIPGHIPPPPGSPMRGWITWDDLEEYARFNRDFLDAVRASKAAGRSVDEAVAALDLRTRYPDHTMDRAAANVQAIYDELDAP
jgi:glyoxylase-like metal-dependent hydrolase (beta-lactamase superfamily II)